MNCISLVVRTVLSCVVLTLLTKHSFPYNERRLGDLEVAFCHYPPETAVLLSDILYTIRNRDPKIKQSNEEGLSEIPVPRSSEKTGFAVGHFGLSVICAEEKRRPCDSRITVFRRWF